jgi:hypothetical protein
MSASIQLLETLNYIILDGEQFIIKIQINKNIRFFVFSILVPVPADQNEKINNLNNKRANIKVGRNR